MRTLPLLVVVMALFAGCSSSTQPGEAVGDASVPDAPGNDAAAALDAAALDASGCTGNAPPCFAMMGYCTDVGGGTATCAKGAWVCPAGTVSIDHCPCGVPPHCSDAGAHD